jgi:alpha-N-arabinofuranosidase
MLNIGHRVAMKTKALAWMLRFLLTLAAGSAGAQNISLDVDLSQTIGKVGPLHFGLMTEEINHSYDGGLYAELVRNRNFMDSATEAEHWALVESQGAKAEMAVDDLSPVNDILTNSLRLDVTTASDSARAGVANEGYWGIPVKPQTSYRCSFYARATPGYNGPVNVSIESAEGAATYAQAKVLRVGANWEQHTVTLKTGDAAPTTKARLVLSVNRHTTLWFSLVSLFPPTFHNRPNGTRIDLMQMLGDMKPAFLRFPGGNYVEGDTVDSRFDWKKTIGPLEQRPGHDCPWGYRSTDGFGLLEFLEWCEDLKMEAVLAVYAGYNLKGTHINPGPDLQPYVQDALDEIEYVTGDATTQWGAQRGKDGHPEPFKLASVEIGNEDWFDRSGSYDARFAQYYDAIKAKYPTVKCISTVGNEHPASQRVHSRKPDLIDEHYYSPAATFNEDSPTHYDKYDRNMPKIFVGEWAAYEDIKPWEPPSKKLPPTPSLKSAMADAAWMAGMERNSDLIVMQCYAPLLVNVNPGARQWRPNLIGYDGLNVYGSPSYYAIQMFSQNHGDSVLKSTVGGGTALNQCATKDSQTGAIYLNFVNAEGTPRPITINLHGADAIAPIGAAITLSGASPDESNSIDNPTHVVPITTAVADVKPTFDFTLPAYSVTILKLNAR